MSESVLIIEARFYDDIADGLLTGARGALEEAGVAHRLVTVPGILEIPAALDCAVAAMDSGVADYQVSGYVVLGCAIRGETDHYHHVCTEAFRGVQDLVLARRLAVGNGILTVHDREQALARALPERKNIGGLAARACLRMMQLKRSLSLA